LTWVGLEIAQAGGERGHDRIEICENVIGEAVFSNRLPQMLGGVQLGAAGWQHEQAHVLWHDQFAGQKPARLVHDHEDELVGVALCETSFWSINRRRRPRSAWRKTSWPTVRRIFFKGGLGRLVCFRMPGSRHDLAPAVSLQQSVDRRTRDVLA
jgi:hypothetical protein